MTFNEMRVQRSLEPATLARPENYTGDFPTGMLDALEKMGLLAAGDRPRITHMGDGDSSAICRIDLGWGTICVKRALTPEHSTFEAEWLKLVRAIVGDAVPEVLGEQPGLFAMEYLDPDRHTSWAKLLRQGDINPSTAAEIGRIKPLLLATAEEQPAVAARLTQLAMNTERTRFALVHGDFSPDNFLIGPKGPVLLDAECAWYGDPAFDLALCLSNLLVECVLQPQWRDYYLTCYTTFCASYTQRVTWEMPEQTDERAALLLPALVLSHVHGRLASERLRGDHVRERIAGLARGLLLDPMVRLGAVREAWRRALSPA